MSELVKSTFARRVEGEVVNPESFLKGLDLNVIKYNMKQAVVTEDSKEPTRLTTSTYSQT